MPTTIHRLRLAGLAIASLAACSQPTDSGGKAQPTKTSTVETSPVETPPVETPPPKAPIAEPSPQPPAPVPFSLALKATKIDGFPGIHSGAGAMHDGRIVLMAGRRNGLHAFPPERKATQIQAFPRTEANETIYVIDPVTATLRGSASITGLPEPIQAQLRATNTQYADAEGWLYVVGGYTYAGKSMKTLGGVTAIDLGALITAIEGNQPLDASFASAHMAQASHLALAIAGGELVEFGGKFLLVFGNQFDGLYTPGESVAVQTYSQSVRVFDFGLVSSSGAPKLTVDFAGADPAVGTQQDSESPYNRRDGSIAPAIDTQGNPRVAAYGGVFKGGRMEGYTTPIYIDAASSQPLGFAITEDTSATQLLSQYDCALIQTYDGVGKVMYSTFLGGISQYFWDPTSGALKRDVVDLGQGIDGLPFISSVSTLRLAATASGTQTGQYLHEGESFPPADARPQCSVGGESETLVDAGLLGAETEFFPVSGGPADAQGVLQLDQITTPTVVGYLVGGIAATTPYSIAGPTCASNMMYTVTLDPTLPTKTIELHAP